MRSMFDMSEGGGLPVAGGTNRGLGRELTSLEHSVLGVLLKLQPCRAHAVVLELAASQTMAYRSKAGSIYPLMNRLAEAGLLAYEGRKYRLSETGLDALREWVRAPIPTTDICTSLDLIRSRAYFLDILSKADVFAFIDSAETQLVALLKSLEARVHEHVDSGDRFGQLAFDGALRETQARIDWIRAVREELSRDYPTPKFK
ncbi:MAG: PadR family transcriptional regulator [Armatimonadetes bacterium]|nr:PadR family transcriptional regulator [Armatimonadota bacterium]